LEAVEQYLPKIASEHAVAAENAPELEPSAEFASVIGREVEPPPPIAISPLGNGNPNLLIQSPADPDIGSVHSTSGTNTYFSLDTDFVSLSKALRVVANKGLTGTLRSSLTKEDLELYTRSGKVVVVTTRDTELYCSEEPILANINPELLARARSTQSQTACPLFITLAREGVILRDSALQLVRHYGQKLFAHLWTASHAQFTFDQSSELPDVAANVSSESDMEDWMLQTLRFVQLEDVAEKTNYDQSWIPTYTRHGLERVEKLQLSDNEARFASQFNGARSIAQIARTLRLDLKLARLILFRFVELEIVECWPPTHSARAGKKKNRS
jgi:hypothetical protein